ncbi:acyl-CoA dehydrogenase family protein [Rhizobacter sp. Root1221]|uniref:acyl-CoA dehydrogenase family protein n=1 Tax=Rhizobacter sp. Root1221 TaxID=1736433 RepID=UPI0006FB5361|nr:acyl-CoA dehydrogenase family protein [Rhizobacter sp. Root1221]KQV99891.1 pimeloyl-CoA dehydrogenase large subunit [Rhizobacter sp. Root1221]
MNFEYTPEQQAFRKEVRSFLESALPVDIRERQALGKRLEAADITRWQKILHAKGWGCSSWPEQYGGTGWNSVQRHIFDEECADVGTPMQLPFGLKMVAPVIMKFANEAQKAHFLPRILSAEDWWCQGYSEPGAGSDLASLKTRAVRGTDAGGEHYIVDGQKTWTTLGQHADWIFCLVRTSTEGRQQEGISFLLIDMKTPGITVRPIIMLDGEHEVNEVWFENVRVPVENRVGEENKGWTYAKFLLGHERTGIAGVGRSKAALKRLKALARRQPGDNGRPLIEDARFRDRIAQVELELMALEITNLKVISNEDKHLPPGPEASMLKIKGSEIQQTLGELTMQALGWYALPYTPERLSVDWQGEPLSPTFEQRDVGSTGHYFNLRKTTIYGGSSEVQKNIIAQMILGL